MYFMNKTPKADSARAESRVNPRLSLRKLKRLFAIISEK